MQQRDSRRKGQGTEVPNVPISVLSRRMKGMSARCDALGSVGLSHPASPPGPFTHRPAQASPRVVPVRLSYACRRLKPFNDPERPLRKQKADQAVFHL